MRAVPHRSPSTSSAPFCHRHIANYKAQQWQQPTSCALTTKTAKISGCPSVRQLGGTLATKGLNLCEEVKSNIHFVWTSVDEHRWIREKGIMSCVQPGRFIPKLLAIELVGGFFVCFLGGGRRRSKGLTCVRYKMSQATQNDVNLAVFISSL